MTSNTKVLTIQRHHDIKKGIDYPKYVVVLPEPLVDQMGWHKGDKLSFEIGKNQLKLTKIHSNEILL
jgi:hypothetical protein